MIATACWDPTSRFLFTHMANQNGYFPPRAYGVSPFDLVDHNACTGQTANPHESYIRNSHETCPDRHWAKHNWHFRYRFGSLVTHYNALWIIVVLLRRWPSAPIREHICSGEVSQSSKIPLDWQIPVLHVYCKRYWSSTPYNEHSGWA